VLSPTKKLRAADEGEMRRKAKSKASQGVEKPKEAKNDEIFVK
jgi:hypothetical protein